MKQLRCTLICHKGEIEQEHNAQLASETGDVEADHVIELAEVDTFSVRLMIWGYAMEVPAVLKDDKSGVKIHEDYYSNQKFTEKVLGKPPTSRPMRMS